MLSKDMGCITENEFNNLILKHEHVSKMLFGLRKGLKKNLNELKETFD